VSDDKYGNYYKYFETLGQDSIPLYVTSNERESYL